MRHYYNDIDPFVAQWLRNLIAAGHLPAGDVDERSIADVQPEDVRGYVQCHWFAGIGGWPLALLLAGWPEDRPAWTGSCPCQPLSSAGQRKGHADERHLWPAFHRLIAECEPATVFGEQVASADGREWLAGVRADLETLGYACGAADLCAAGVGAPHIRQRLYWVADTDRTSQRADRRTVRDERHNVGGCSSAATRLGDAPRAGLEGQRRLHRPGGARCGGQSRSSVQADVPQWNGATVAAQRQDGPVRIPAEPALFPVAQRVSGDLGRLRGSGNAIVPQVAAAFIRAFMECRP